MVRSIVLLLTLSLCFSTACGGDDGETVIDAGGDLLDGDYCPPGPDGGNGGPADGDGSGTWAVMVVTYANVQGLGGDQIAHLTFVHEMTQDGTELTGTETMCSMEIDSVDEMTTVRVTPAFIAALPAQDRTGRLTPDGEGGYDYQADELWLTRGVTLDDVENDELPTDPEDPRIGDWDEDGHPGVTLLINGLLSGMAYVIQRDHTQFDGTQTGADRISGLVTWGSEQIYLGSDPAAIADLAGTAFPDPDPSKHTVQLVRIPAGEDCAYVVEHRCSLFGE